MFTLLNTVSVLVVVMFVTSSSQTINTETMYIGYVLEVVEHVQ